MRVTAPPGTARYLGSDATPKGTVRSTGLRGGLAVAAVPFTN